MKYNYSLFNTIVSFQITKNNTLLTHYYILQMANLREIKSKIGSVNNLKKITRALEVVSTVKLQKVKAQAEGLKSYLLDLLSILAHLDNAVGLYDTDSATSNGRKLAIIVTSERGLCGGLNSKLLRTILKNTDTDVTDYFVIGKKWLEFVKRMGGNIVWNLNVWDNFKESDLLPLYAFFDQAVGEYKSIDLHFNYFKNSIAQIPSVVQMMPFTQDSFEYFLEQINVDMASQINTGEKEMIIEPDHATLIAEAKRQIRNYVLASAIVQNKAGEHAARMIAMKNAKDNATDFVKSLTLTFNKARQGAITQEISEIVSAKIAIGG